MKELNARLRLCRKTGGKVLDISRMEISSLDCVREFPELRVLDCSSTQVSDLAPLAGLTELEALYCAFTNVKEFSPIQHLIQKGISIEK